MSISRPNTIVEVIVDMAFTITHFRSKQMLVSVEISMYAYIVIKHVLLRLLQPEYDI